MKLKVILPFVVFVAFSARGHSSDIYERFAPLRTKMQQIVDDSTRDLSDPKFAAEAGPRQIFLHSAIVTNIHSGYLQTLFILWMNAETAGDRESARKALALWSPTIRDAIGAGQKFIRGSMERAYSGSFHAQMRDAMEVYDGLLAMTEEISRVVEEKG